MANYIERDLGKQMVDEYFKVGQWYEFPVANSNANYRKFMRIDKIYESRTEPYACMLKGKGFVIKDNQLHNPITSTPEIIRYVWAESYILDRPLWSEREIKEIYKAATNNSFNTLFE